MTPGAMAWRGATWAVVVAIICLTCLFSWDALAEPSPNYYGLIVIAGYLVVLIVAGLALLLLRLIIKALPVRYAYWFGALVTLIVAVGLPGNPALRAAVVVISVSLIGAGLGSLRHTGWRALTLAQRLVVGIGLLIGMTAVAWVAVWLVLEGRPLKQVPNAGRQAAASVPPISLTDPGKAGAFRVRRLTYGSGHDIRRPEFAGGVAIKTSPVDGSKLLERWKGRSGWARTKYWGFDAKSLPLQGRVWYPEGDGAFPLVLAVHGNHSMEESSDPGYGYLGELLASRGYIFVTVDENFLNSSFSDLIGIPTVGLKEENDARGWLLLEHLKAWRAWSTTAGSPFSGHVDMTRIALIGHSRGGEAVAVAAAFNRLPYYPDNARLRFDYGFAIRSVIAIAPVDGQYKPANTWTRPIDVNYFVLQGSMDGDMQSFHGSRVFERVTFTGAEPCFKATLYVHGANHGQFNTVWGRNDASGVWSWFMNHRAIMPPDDQRRIARVFMSAFLEATLRAATGYKPLFRDYRRGLAWLPNAICLQDYSDSADRNVATYEEDLDLTSTTVAGGSIDAAHLSDWKERALAIKWGALDTRGVYLGWDREKFKGEPSYTISVPGRTLELGPDAALTFAMADARDDPSAPDEETKPAEAGKKKDTAKGGARATDKKKDDKKPEVRQPIDLTIEVADEAGAVARLPLSRFSALQPQLESQVPKAAFLGSVPTSEIVFTTFEFPLAWFRESNPAFDPAALKLIRLVFNRTDKAVVILDDVGFRRW